MGSQVISEDRNRFPGRETVGEVRRGGRRAKFGQERRASSLPCLSLDLGDDRRSTSGSGNVSLAIFITSVNDSKSLASFTNRFFLFSGPPGFRLAFDAAERNGRFDRIQCQRSKESSSRGKRERRVLLCRRSVRVKVRSKVIRASFLKLKKGGHSLRRKTGESGTNKRIGR